MICYQYLSAVEQMSPIAVTNAAVREEMRSSRLPSAVNTAGVASVFAAVVQLSLVKRWHCLAGG